MQKLLPLVALWLLANGCMASGFESIPRLTANELVERMNKTDERDRTILEKNHIWGYMAGVADASQGSKWCDPGNVKRDEIDSYVLGELRKVPKDQSRVSAATLITELLNKRFPCR